MANYILLRSQKNDVLELVKSSGLDPFNFKWSVAKSKHQFYGDGHSEPVERLTYNESTFYFQFDFHKKQHYAIFAPGRDKFLEEQYPGTWVGQLSYVGSWLTYLKREVQQPDLWAELSKYGLPPGDTLPAGIRNEPFTVKEAEELSEGIKKVRAYIETEFHLNTDQQRLVDEKLDYLLEATKRQGRTDWLHTSIGVIFTLASAMAFSPEQTKNIWNILKAAFTGIIYLIR